MLTCVTVERVHWLCAKAQFERWLEEQDSIHNEDGSLLTFMPRQKHGGI